MNQGTRKPGQSAFGAASAVGGVVLVTVSAEQLLRAALGRHSEWIPIALAALALAGAGAILAAGLRRFTGPVAATVVALIVPLLPLSLYLSRRLVPSILIWPAAFITALVLAAISARLALHPRLHKPVVGAALLAFGFCWVPYRAGAPPLREPARDDFPDIILLVLDTTRADRLSLYGHVDRTSPRLDAFAQEAEVYENAWSVSPWTPPSHVSMITGLLPAEHGVDGVERPSLPAHLITLPRVLAESGYRTAGFVANPNLFAPGWDDHFDTYLPSWLEGSHSLLSVLNDLLGYSAGAGAWAAERGTSSVFARARTWWHDNDGGARFLFLNIIDPHHPYTPPSRYYERHLGQVDPDDAYAVNQDPIEHHAYPGVTPDEQAILRGLYDAEIESMDRQVGDLFDWLGARGELDSTIIVVTSDHGEHLGERGLVGHMLVIDHYLLRVPLVVRYPRRLRPGRIPRPVQLDGIPGYILHLADVEAPEPMGARSLHLQDRDVLIAQRRSSSRFLSALLDYAPGVDAERYIGEFAFVTDGNLALTWPVRLGATGAVLTDLRADPDYERDVAEQHPEVAARLRGIATSLPAYPPVEETDLAPEAIERLKALGYIR